MISDRSGAEEDLGVEAVMSAVASGRVEPAVALFLDAAMELRGHADAAPGALSGALLEREASVAMAPDALARALAAIDALETAPAPRAAARRDAELIRLPRALQEAVRDAERRRGWTSALPGIRSLDLETAGDVHAEIIRIEPGVATPRHTHGGREYTLCLLGGFSDGRGSYGPGDVCEADPEVTHTPRADADGPCYVLALTDAGLRFTGLLGALQRLLGR